MRKSQLKEYIDLYRETEKSITDLDDKFGIRIWDSKDSNFYNNYNLMLHKLLVIIFDEVKVDLLEDYIFEQIEMTFDELCKALEIDETDNK